MDDYTWPPMATNKPSLLWPGFVVASTADIPIFVAVCLGGS